MKNNSFNDEEKDLNLSGEDSNETASNLSNKKDNSSKLTKKTIAILSLSALLLGSGASTAYVFAVDPYLKTKQAEKELSAIFEQRGPIQPENTTVFDFNVEYTENVGDLAKQKSLGSDNAPSMSTFIFTNGKVNENSSTLELYLDFNSQKSRDFFNLNSEALKNLVESGKITLKILPVPSQNPLSAYAPEALSLVFEKQPNKAWESLKSLFKLSVVIADEKITDKNEVLERIVKAVNSTGVSLTSDDILKGEYASWILSVATSENLKTSGGIPALYLNGSLVNQDEIDILNSESLVKYIWNSKG